MTTGSTIPQHIAEQFNLASTIKTECNFDKLRNTPFIVEYAYPSSDTARFYRKSTTGCYFITGRGPNGTRFNASSHGYELKAEAQAFCDIYNQSAI